MNTLQLFTRLAFADVRERTRRYSFAITLLFMLYAAYMFTPPNHAQYVTLQMGGHRGIYNSAWIGALVAMMATTFMSLAGFYLVKNSISRDRETGVGQILAASPLTKLQYILSKVLSNVLVLGVMLIVLLVGAGVMQVIRGEVLSIEIWELSLPFLFIAFPAMVLVAAVAVLFESVRFLRGGLGNALFFFLWIFSISGEALKTTDVLGIEYVINSMTAATHKAFPVYDVASQSLSMGFNVKDSNEQWHLTTFHWNGVDWHSDFMFHRIGWLVFAFGLCVIASICFDRFDTSIVAGIHKRKRKRFWKKIRNATEGLQPERNVVEVKDDRRAPAILSRILSLSTKSRFGQLLIAELKVMLNGISTWWFIVAAGLIIAGALTPMSVSREFILPFAWVWPLLLWSPMGTRERRYQTDQLFFSVPHVLVRQLPAMWLAGVLIAVVTGMGVAFQFILVGDVLSLSAWIIGALFIPTLALTMGVWTGSSKMFEIIYLILWYLGPMNKAPFLDYLGASTMTTAGGIHYYFAGITLVLASLAILGRKRQLSYD